MKTYRPWTTAEIRKLRELRNTGLSRAEIAAQMGRTFKSIKHALEKQACHRKTSPSDAEILRAQSAAMRRIWR